MVLLDVVGKREPPLKSQANVNDWTLFVERRARFRQTPPDSKRSSSILSVKVGSFPQRWLIWKRGVLRSVRFIPFFSGLQVADLTLTRFALG
jgi:hypothetical protein